jgi:adenosylcobinamide-phosphate synthase
MPIEYFILALILDIALGDPRLLPHPVEAMGVAISMFEGIFRNPALGPRAQKVAGALMTAVIVAGAFAVSFALIALAYRLLGHLGGAAATVILAYTTISVRGLAKSALMVARPLFEGDIDSARRALSMIVGRDTAALDEREIARGAVESVAENASDGVVAPLFYLAIGGVPFAMAYKAVNTMDSMVGYKTDEYLNFGWAAARLDDAANFIPARLAALFVTIASGLLGLVYGGRFSIAGAWRVFLRDRLNHPSPNSGHPEAAFAGALGVRLGGAGRYFGKTSVKPYIGDPSRELSPDTVDDAVRLLYATSFVSLAALASFSHLIYHIKP